MEHNYKNNSNNVIQNPAILTPTCPVPNLVHNIFYTPQMHRSVGNDLGYHPAQFMTPQGKSYSSSHEFDYHYPPSDMLPSQGSNLSLTNGYNHPGFTSTPGKRYRDNATAEGPDIPVYQDERHCVECKYAEAMRADYRMDNSSYDDQVRTFCTVGTPYLSTATSLTDQTQAGKADGERDEDMNMSGQDNYDDGAASKNATLIDPDRFLTDSDRTMTK
ncbi:adenomatous polyposis coli protein [Biomphalaria pfeifferi]|uniref:Adenomatous polyposis coli protein n=1 Tax=Biomphalaria pfeifferi TaxID=112525 RepID=A0AAD8FLT9_BIOPF|nr:adenomatous polyposis coli protein [Biomphalaria pfeifferi]